MTPLQKPHRDAHTLTELIRSATPILDVRAENEYAAAHSPNSANLPILTSLEREQVGIAYKNSGPDAAVSLGHVLVNGNERTARVEAWQHYCATHPDCWIMCWRGGQRSQIAQTWLQAENVDRPRVPGGYKALRRLCLEVLESVADGAHAAPKSWWIVGGRTGVQKTTVIQHLPQAIDLERRANHRGSAFGSQATPQPSQATFENALAYDYLAHEHAHLVVEDESRTIGRNAIPQSWFEKMQESPVVLIDATLEERVAYIETEYVTGPSSRFGAKFVYGKFELALKRISRRLGGVRYRAIAQTMHDAFQAKASHRDWIRTLLRDYYDPMYDYQLENKENRIVFKGSRIEVLHFLDQQLSRGSPQPR